MTKDSNVTGTALLRCLSEVLKNYISSEELIHSAVCDFQAHCSYMLNKLEEDIRVSAMAEANALVVEIKREKDSWEVEKMNIAAIQSFESRIKLDVGGNRFTTSLATLRLFPDTMLGAMFSGRHVLHQDEDGYHFIDRDGTHFRYILQFLRSPETFECELTGAALRELKNEFDFYGLKDMMFPPQTIPAFVCYNSLAQPTRVTQDTTGVWRANNVVLKLCEHCIAAEYDSFAPEAVNPPSLFDGTSSGGFTFGNNSNNGFAFGSGRSGFGSNTTTFGGGNGNGNTGFGNSSGSFGNNSGGFGRNTTGFGSNSTGFGSNFTGFGNATAGFGSNTTSFGGNSAGFTFGSGNTVFGNGNTGVSNVAGSATTANGNDSAEFTFGTDSTPAFSFGGNTAGFSFGNNTGGFGISNSAGNNGTTGFTFGSIATDSAGTGMFAMPVQTNQRQFILNFRRIVEEKGGCFDFSVQPIITEKCHICNRSPSPSIDDEM